MAAAGTGVQVGLAIVATRYAIGQTTPIQLALLRYTIGFCCLAPVVLATARARIAPRDLVPIALLGIGQFGILIWLLNFGLQFITAGRAALVFATFPLLTMLLAFLMRMERLSPARIGGVALSVVGVGFALGGGKLGGGGGPHEWIGALAVLGSAFTGALCSVLYRPFLGRYPPLPVSAIAMLSAVLFLSVLAAGEGFFHAFPRFTPGAWVAVVFIGVSSGGGYFLWLWALKNTSPTTVTMFLSLSPIVAGGLGALLLHEPISATWLVGVVAVAAGLWLALPPRAPTTTQASSG